MSSIFRCQDKESNAFLPKTDGDIGNYVIGEKLGEGRVAKVFKAKVKESGRDVAIKVLDKQKLSKTDYLSFLRDEYELTRVLNHKNCTKTYEIFEQNEMIYFVMEMMSNGDLLTKLNKVKYFPEEQAAVLFRPIVQAVQHCHELNFVHRDIKCENVLLSAEMDAKLCDFGFAAPCELGKKLFRGCGSLEYACPEILLRRPYDGRWADVWSLGVVLYCMVCGKLPFEPSRVPQEMVDQMQKGAVFPKRVPKSCRELVRKMLQVDPRSRVTVEEILKDDWLMKFQADEAEIKEKMKST